MAHASGRVVAFRPPTRRRLHQDVADQLRDAILDGRFTAGQRLPSERDLAAEFQVNRTSVREAIKVLEGVGLVTVRQGDGATVQPLVDASFDVLAPMLFHGDRVDTTLLAEINEVIGPLLLEMARLAVERHRPSDLVILRRLRDDMADESREQEERYAACRDLMVELADMTRNRVWQMLARRTRSFLASPQLREARRHLRRDPGRIVPIVDECLAAVEAGRTADAIAAVHRFIRVVGDTTVPTTPTNTVPTRRKGARR